MQVTLEDAFMDLTHDAVEYQPGDDAHECREAGMTVGRVALGAPTGGRTTVGVLRSEWTKLWSLRSTRWSLLVAFVAQAGLGCWSR